jgi:hypothetical protein
MVTFILTLTPHTFFNFHLPLLKIKKEAIDIHVSATGTAMNTPSGPSLKYIASK